VPVRTKIAGCAHGEVRENTGVRTKIAKMAGVCALPSCAQT
jgi:hypothetical protein